VAILKFKLTQYDCMHLPPSQKKRYCTKMLLHMTSGRLVTSCL